MCAVRGVEEGGMFVEKCGVAWVESEEWVVGGLEKKACACVGDGWVRLEALHG